LIAFVVDLCRISAAVNQLCRHLVPYALLMFVQSGLNVLQGWQQMKQFYDHLTVNFVGAAAAMVALQVEVCVVHNSLALVASL
jgi:hypothetical protein